jgi:RimJ/RimL family protein N-acetyltransferase
MGQGRSTSGIASIAVKLLTNDALDELGLARKYSGIFEYNTASMRIREKNGYIKEGIFRKAIFKKGSLWDEHRYA